MRKHRENRERELRKQEELRQKECGSKKKLLERAAKSEARHLSLTLGENLQAYKCSFCDYWHVGHV